jgi:uncharacterized oxidoreductase
MDIRIAAGSLAEFTNAVLTAAGSDPEEAQIVAAHLVEANLKGHDSHGVGMLPQYWRNLVSGNLVPGRHAEVAVDSGAIRVFDGGRGYGQIIAREATAWAIEKVRSDGIGMYGLRNSHHVGRVGTYGEQAAAAGFASIQFVNVLSPSARQAPFGGREGRFGTNPVCIAFPPVGDIPAFVLDFATTALAVGKIRVAHNKGAALPAGTYIDDDGHETTDPSVLLRDRKGALLSFGGYKATGLALACELLAGVLTGSGANRQPPSTRPDITNGMLSIVFDPARLTGAEMLHEEVGAVLGWVRSSRPRFPGERVLIAGEPEMIAMAERREHGILFDGQSWADIRAVALEAGLSAGRIDALIAG